MTAETHTRPRRMYHDRIKGQNWLSCCLHGPQKGPLSQDAAELGHACGEKCPTCTAEIAERMKAKS